MNNLPLSPGVYCLWNKITNQIYVGSSVNLQKRIKQHFSSRCHNPYLKRSIKKYGKENFSITWFETETESKFLEEEQRLLNYVFNNSISTFNVAIKAGGGKVLSDYSSHRALSLKGKSREELRLLSLKGKSREELRLLSEAGGGAKAVPLFLIDTKTKVATELQSSQEGERLGFGPQQNLSNFSKPNCLNQVKSCLVARSEVEALKKLEAWLQIPRNNPIVLELPERTKQSALYKLANVNQSNFSQMYRKVLKPSTGEPRCSAMQSKSDFNWYGTEIKVGDWFSCTATVVTH